MTPARRRLVAFGAAVVVGAVVLVAISLFGVRRVPSYPSLADAPDRTVTGWIAYGAASVDAQPGVCVTVVPAGGGASRRITCNGGGPFTWSSDGMLQVYSAPSIGSSYAVTRYDPVTGADQGSNTTTTPPKVWPDVNPQRADGAILGVTPYRVTVGTPSGTVTILEATHAPDRFGYRVAHWSPDGRWVLVLDSTKRLLLVRADGEGGARVVARDVASVFAWWQPQS